MLFLFLLGCSEISSEESNEIKDEKSRFVKTFYEEIEPYNEIEIMTDTKTGCKYLIHGGSKFTSGMSVLLDEYGKPVGCKLVK